MTRCSARSAGSPTGVAQMVGDLLPGLAAARPDRAERASPRRPRAGRSTVRRLRRGAPRAAHARAGRRRAPSSRSRGWSPACYRPSLRRSITDHQRPVGLLRSPRSSPSVVPPRLRPAPPRARRRHGGWRQRIRKGGAKCNLRENVPSGDRRGARSPSSHGIRRRSFRGATAAGSSSHEASDAADAGHDQETRRS